MTRLSVALVYTIFLLWLPLGRAVQVTSIRLVNGSIPSTRVGRVEIEVDNNPAWGSICDDGWDNKDAIVACRMLGFTNGGTAVTDTRFGAGSYIFLMDDSACTGDEISLSQCLASQTSDCTRNTDTEAGVVCNENLAPGQTTQAPAPTTTLGSTIINNCQQTNPTIRLVARQDTNVTGFVQLLSPTGTWGYLCDDGWDELGARVACSQLCFSANFTAVPGIPAEYAPVRPANSNIILDNIKCFGNESTLQNCQHGVWDTSDCLTNGGELAGVQCRALPSSLTPPAPVPILICGEGKMVAQFSRKSDTNLEAKHLTVFRQPNCADVTKSTTTDYVSITIPVDKCGTNVFRNGTHIIYSIEIKYDATLIEDSITRVNTYIVSITCILPVAVQATQKVEPVTQAVTQSSVGVFPVSLTIYRDDSFLVPATDNPVKIPLGEYLNFAFAMESYDSNLKLVVTDCAATPTGDLSLTTQKVLIANKCSQESSLSFYPLNNFKYGFRFKPFKFVGYDILYIHCNATICLAQDVTQECDRTCANTKPSVASPTTGRKRRDIKAQHVPATSVAILIYDPFNPVQIVVTSNSSSSNTNNNNQIGFMTVIKTTTPKAQQPTTQIPIINSLTTSKSQAATTTTTHRTSTTPRHQTASPLAQSARDGSSSFKPVDIFTSVHIFLLLVLLLAYHFR